MGCLFSKNNINDNTFDYSTGSNNNSNGVLLESTKPYIPPNYTSTNSSSSNNKGNNNNGSGNNNNKVIIISDSEAIILASNYCKNSAFQWQDEALVRIGSRRDKWNFIVRGTDSESSKILPMVLSLTSIQDFPISLSNQSTVDVYANLLCAITHPYIFPCEDVDYIKDKCILVTIRKFNEKGSLKDLIYGKQNPKHKYSDKYRQDYSRPLRPKVIRAFGRHILEGLSALNAKGIICDNLKSSNVLIDNGVARISELETTLLGNGLADDIFEVIIEYEIRNEGKICSIDVLLFGFLLLEMISGVPFHPNNFFNEITEEFATRFASLNSSPENESLHNILQSIFIQCDATIESLLGHEFFQSVELVHTPQKIKLQSIEKGYIKTLIQTTTDRRKRRKELIEKRNEAITNETQQKLKELEEHETAEEIVNKRRNKSMRRGSSAGSGNNTSNSGSTSTRRRQSLLNQQHNNSIHSNNSNPTSPTSVSTSTVNTSTSTSTSTTTLSTTTRGSEESAPIANNGQTLSTSISPLQSNNNNNDNNNNNNTQSSSQSSVPPQYQKLLNIGLSQEAVKHKMLADGFDPAVCGW